MRSASSLSAFSRASSSARSAARRRASSSCCARMASCRRCSTPAICCHILYSASTCASAASISSCDFMISDAVFPLGFCFWRFSSSLRLFSAIMSATTLAFTTSPPLDSTRASQPCSGVSACSNIGSPFASCGNRCNGVASEPSPFPSGLGPLSGFSGTPCASIALRCCSCSKALRQPRHASEMSSCPRRLVIASLRTSSERLFDTSNPYS